MEGVKEMLETTIKLITVISKRYKISELSASDLLKKSLICEDVMGRLQRQIEYNLKEGKYD